MVNNAQNLEVNTLMNNDTLQEEVSNINNESSEVKVLDSAAVIVSDTPVVNCLALAVRKEYSLTIAKNIFFKTCKTTWKIGLSILVLNFLSFFF